MTSFKRTTSDSFSSSFRIDRSTTRSNQALTYSTATMAALSDHNRQRRYNSRTDSPTSPASTSQRKGTTALLTEDRLNKINTRLDELRHVDPTTPITPSPNLQEQQHALPRLSINAHRQRDSILDFDFDEQVRRSGLRTTAPSPRHDTFSMDQKRASNSIQPVPPIGNFSVQIQEYAMIEDLLHMLVGVDGNYITCNRPAATHMSDNEENNRDDMITDDTNDYEDWDATTYTMDPTLDPSIKMFVSRVISLATYYMSVEAFIQEYSRFEYGTVNHALCAGMREFLKSYSMFVAQLEHAFHNDPAFTFQKLWFYAQDIMQDMRILHQLTMTLRSIPPIQEEDPYDYHKAIEKLKEKKQQRRGNTAAATVEQVEEAEDEGKRLTENQKGGAILNVLSDRLIRLSGDPKCKRIYSFLLSKASVPYFDILQQWIYRGEIKDSYDEFMVIERRNVTEDDIKEDFNDAYWETRYTLRENTIPSFLVPMKNQILLAGKFLNVVRGCGITLLANPEEMQNALVLEEQQRQQQQQQFQQQRQLRGRSASSSNSSTVTPTNQPSPSNNSFIPNRSEVWTAVNGIRFEKNLEIAYKYANYTLLNLLIHDNQLLPRLKSLKHYFLLDQADFLTSFLDLAKEELKQPASEIPQSRLQSLMDLVLRNPSSVAAYDPFKDDIVVAMSSLRLHEQLLEVINVTNNRAHMQATSYDIHVSSNDDNHHDTPISASLNIANSHKSNSHLFTSPNLSSSSTTSSLLGHQNDNAPLTGYEALTLDYKITFPLSLVISRKSLTKYQLIFRHMLQMKNIEDKLCSLWSDQKDKLWKFDSRDAQIQSWKFRVFQLRNRMLTFVQQIAFYVANEVVEPNWLKLEAKLMSVSTVDQVLQYHSQFLDTCLSQCMLTNPKLLRIFNKIIASCFSFIKEGEQYTQLLIDIAKVREPDELGLPRHGLNGETETRFEECYKNFFRLEDTFNYHMKLLLTSLNYFSAQETSQFLCLVVRLDYNQYYSNTTTTVTRTRTHAALQQQQRHIRI